MKVLVTGGAGFIGSHIVEGLLKGGYEVRVLDDFSTGNIRNLESVKDKIEIINGDIRNFEIVNKACEGIDYISHQAASISVERSIREPKLCNEVNINGTLNVLLVAKNNNVKRVIYGGSSAVYGDSQDLPKKEDSKTEPISPYGLSKLIGEKYCKLFYNLYGLETITLRYFNVFGPRQDPDSEYAAVIPKFITLMLNNKQPTIFGDGKQSRDFTFVKNVVDANILAIEAKKVSGDIVNIACGTSISLDQLVKKLNGILGKNLEPIYDKPRKGDVKHSLADVSKARKLLEYKPRFSFEEGLNETVKWYNRCKI